MDYYWILSVFVGGFLLRLFQLPPLIGFLCVGFALNAYGLEPLPVIDTLANLGVTLLLFTIGLKINLSYLLKKEILVSASFQCVGNIVVAIVFIKLLLGFLIASLSDVSSMQAFYIALALSFSSTVCAVKILEDKSELKTRHGQIILSILVIQDIIAVLFLTVMQGELPHAWALLLFGLPFARPLMSKLLIKSGHGEMLPLAGIFLALSGGELFQLAGLKADLGALIFGMLLSKDKKASELSKSLLAFKDILLIGFFLSIGFKAIPDVNALMSALMLLLILPLKALIFFFSLIVCKFRSRTAFLTALALSNYSEFGLIVAVVCERSGLLSSEWLVILAIACSLSFLISSVANKHAHIGYARWAKWLKKYEVKSCLQEDIFRQPGQAKVLVVGMGRVGKGAYDALEKHYPGCIWGVDANNYRVEKMMRTNHMVTFGDAEDADFWGKVDLSSILLILLTMPKHVDMLEALAQLRLRNYQGKIAGIAKYEDERQELMAMGVDIAFNFYAEAGAGFAEESYYLLDNC